MLKSQKQIRILYWQSAIGAFQIAGASWVALLAARGFSLVEIGVAESVFHLTSFICELPSGMASDIFGRKRSMLISQCLSILSALAMLTSRAMPGILVAMALSAMSYNFASGTREALAYDSLKLSGLEGRYDAYSSTELILYRISGSAATLCAGLALAIGYRRAYLIDLLLGIICLFVVLRLTEVRAENAADPTWRNMKGCLCESIRFLRGNTQALRIIFLNAAVGAVATLLAFFLQARLPECGLPRAALGPVLFVMGLGGAVGARAALLVRRRRYRSVFICAAAAVTLCLLGSFVRLPALMALCGFTAALFDSLIEVRSDVQLNQMIPSEQRATLLSASSLCFSVIMMLLSPALGKLFSLV